MFFEYPTSEVSPGMIDSRFLSDNWKLNALEKGLYDHDQIRPERAHPPNSLANEKP
jgi:hypothetical protein